jgi:hypothetical protein
MAGQPHRQEGASFVEALSFLPLPPVSSYTCTSRSAASWGRMRCAFSFGAWRIASRRDRSEDESRVAPERRPHPLRGRTRTFTGLGLASGPRASPRPGSRIPRNLLARAFYIDFRGSPNKDSHPPAFPAPGEKG